MSYDAMTWAIRQRLEPVPRLILLALADRANKRGLAWPSVVYLAEFCGFHRSTILRELKRLVRLRLIEDSGERRGQTRQVKVWTLLMDEEPLPLPKPRRGKGISIGDALPDLKGFLNGETVSQLGNRFTAMKGSPRKTVAPNAGKGRSGATRNQLEQVTSYAGAGAREEAAAPALAKTEAVDVFENWNRMAAANGLPVADELNGVRLGRIEAAIAKHGSARLLGAIASVPTSKFLTNQSSRPFKASLDFVLIPERLTMLLAGAYHDWKTGGR